MRRDTASLADGSFDVLVVGAGIHGAWLALRAAASGYRTALVERDDFGAATSANSLKILHGGLRYLQTLDVPRMRKSVDARREFARFAPQLVEPLACLLPLGAAGLRSPWAFGPALLLNEIISTGQRSGVAPRARLPRGGLIGAREARARLEPLTDRAPFGGGIWWDLVMRESDRMTLEVVLAAAQHGAVVANRVEALTLCESAGHVAGAVLRDLQASREFDIRTRFVIDATGPWAGRLAGPGLPASVGLPQRWVGGINLVLDRNLGHDGALALTAEVQGRRRELFFVPWQGVTMIGTHYVPVPGPMPQAPRAAVDEFLAIVARVAPRAGIGAGDIARVHWGVLPCAPGSDLDPAGQPVVAIGREATGRDGYALVIGEKYTSAPVVARSVIDRLAAMLGAPRVSGPALEQGAAAGSPGAPTSAATRDSIAERIRRPVDAAEVRHAIREEMALSLGDVVERRLGLGERGSPGLDVLREVARLAAPEFGWDAAVAERAGGELQRDFEARRRGA